MTNKNRISPAEYRENLQRQFGTKNLNPLYRWGTAPYEMCRFCGLEFTYLGIGRHERACGSLSPPRLPKVANRKKRTKWLQK